MFALRMSSAVGRQLARVSARGFADAPTGMAFTLASPSNLYFHGADVRQVDVPSYSGNFGILPNHVSTSAVIKPGVVVVYPKEGDLQRFFVSAGTITVNEDSSVQVIAEQAIAVDQLDGSLVGAGLAKAQQQLASASTETAKAEAQILIEVHEAMQKAIDGVI
ncbi:ATP synthase subunit delta, mitochondrial [Galendromus occidentalis]|uniref:ATP synthase F(1) complex subunit delta, mitochondrial n=1 Tax=Galendromus occidentalis TaxID=34638 RepID=A0AAJ6VWI5_9ACAR|nr:ATP synthase subunit delta, mitochondrial [Galendromus occidentalis]